MQEPPVSLWFAFTLLSFLKPPLVGPSPLPFAPIDPWRVASPVQRMGEYGLNGIKPLDSVEWMALHPLPCLVHPLLPFLLPGVLQGGAIGVGSMAHLLRARLQSVP